MNSYSNIVKCFLVIFFSSVSINIQALECKTVTTDSIANPKNTISYIFDKEYPCGRFANGDWWVSPQKKGDAVVIKEITPESNNGSHGFMVNPSKPNIQTYDARAGMFDQDLIINLPIKIDYPASIIKAVSSEAENEKKCRPCLLYASVLTVLTEPLSNSQMYLRPGYYGSDKDLFKVNLDGWKQKLNKAQFSYSGKYAPKISKISKRYQHVQLEALEDWSADALHPKDNLPHYGARIATDNAESFLRFLLNDFNLNDADHLSAFINYLQMSVDLFTLADNGFKWRENGGHTNGRKLPLVIGRYFIDEQKFKHALGNSIFSEDQQIYLSKKTNQVLYGVECTEEVYWRSVIIKKGDRTCRDPYELIDGGGSEVGGAYQFCCTVKPWTYTALVLKLMKIEDLWSNNLIFSYVNRWTNHGAITKPDDCAAFNGNPDDLGKLYGPDGNGDCIKGNGRWPELDGLNKNNGGYESKFADEIISKITQDGLF